MGVEILGSESSIFALQSFKLFSISLPHDVPLIIVLLRSKMAIPIPKKPKYRKRQWLSTVMRRHFIISGHATSRVFYWSRQITRPTA